jgi:anti-sigma regulatory factor (Ser/Thr protein kinase)
MGGQRPAARGPTPVVMHDAVLYRSDRELLAATVPFITEGLAAGDQMMIAAPERTLALVGGALPDLNGQVSMKDMRRVGRNPGAILPTVLLAFAAAHPGRRVRIIGEPIWAGRSREEYLACAQHEALINAAFAGRDAIVRCPYDATSLPPAWLEDAARTHPLIGTPARIAASSDYRDPTLAAASFAPPLPEPPATAVRLTVRLGDLSRLRQLVAELAGAAGLPDTRAGDLVVAVDELAANSILHGGGAGRAAFWATGAGVVCQVSDTGHIADPLAGRIPVPPETLDGGRGLVLVNALCDLVRVHTTPAGTTVRVWMER